MSNIFIANGQITFGVSSNYINDFVYGIGNEKLGFGVNVGYEKLESKHSFELGYIFMSSKEPGFNRVSTTHQQQVWRAEYAYQLLSIGQFNLTTGLSIGRSEMLFEELRPGHIFEILEIYKAWHPTIPLIVDYTFFDDKLSIELKGEAGYYLNKINYDLRMEYYEPSPTHHPFFLGSVGVKYRFDFGKLKS